MTTLIGAETALGFVFDPRYRDFPFAALTMAVVPFAPLTLLNRPQEGARPIAEAVFAGLLAVSALYTGVQRRPRQLAVAVDLRGLFRCSPLRCGGRGPCKSQNKQADREPRQADIVEHDAEPGGDQPARQQHDRRPDARAASR